MRTSAASATAASAKNALLIECGQIGRGAPSASPGDDMAIPASSRCRGCDAADREIEPRVTQRLVRVTTAVVASSPAFRFAKSFTGSK